MMRLSQSRRNYAKGISATNRPFMGCRIRSRNYQRLAMTQVSPGANSTEGIGKTAFCNSCRLRIWTRSTLGNT